MISFEWHEAKDRANQKKHGISFEEAKSLFFDEYAVQFYDEGHSVEEDRFIMLGMSSESRILIVCHCERERSETIRIISARRATKNERRFYPQGAS